MKDEISKDAGSHASNPGDGLGEAKEALPMRLTHMPRDVGWLLVIAGIFGEVAPGVFGTPFWVAGTLVLNPKLGWRVEKWLERRAPRTFAGGIRQIGRFLDDLEKRYPRIDERRRH